MSLIDQLIAALSSLFGKQPTVTDVYQPTYGNNGTNIPNALPISGKPKQINVRHVQVHALDRQGLRGRVDPNDFARGYSVQGYSTAQLIALARKQAPRGFVPHNIAQEGQVTTIGGKKYIKVKFSDPTQRHGSTTENVRIA